jgi:signal peptidase I
LPALRGVDRTWVNRRLRPRRWDIIVYRFPEDRSVNYAHRLIGLPGERIELRDGRVTINGQVIEKPSHLWYLNYCNSPSPGESGWGGEGNPITLGADEYYVLGDFSARSRDSRVWERGAPGHPPYAVPASDVVGVVTQIYWPPERWRVFERVGGD